MKTVLQLLAASALSAGMVIGGVVIASAALSPEEEEAHQFTGLDIRELWTAEPVRIDPAAQNLERLPPRYASHVVMIEPAAQVQVAEANSAQENLQSKVAQIDLASTGAVDDEPSESSPDTLSPQHIGWCSQRYRSYDSLDNTYRSFSGELRDCVSPYEIEAPADYVEDEAQVMTVSSGSSSSASYLVEDGHAAGCMERYRSYRASDNTYQPYGGGPRRQCELASF